MHLQTMNHMAPTFLNLLGDALALQEKAPKNDCAPIRACSCRSKISEAQLTCTSKSSQVGRQVFTAHGPCKSMFLCPGTTYTALVRETNDHLSHISFEETMQYCRLTSEWASPSYQGSDFHVMEYSWQGTGTRTSMPSRSLHTSDGCHRNRKETCACNFKLRLRSSQCALSSRKAV